MSSLRFVELLEQSNYMSFQVDGDGAASAMEYPSPQYFVEISSGLCTFRL